MSWLLHPWEKETLVFALQLVITGSVYWFSMDRREDTRVPWWLWPVVYFAIAWVVPDFSILLAPLVFFLLYCLMLFAVAETDPKLVCFLGAATFSTQHTAVALCDALRCALHIPSDTPLWNLMCLFSFAGVLTVCYLAFGRRMRHILDVKIQSKRLIFISCLMLAVVYVLRVVSLRELSQLAREGPLHVSVHLYSMVGSFASLMFLFSANSEGQLMGEKQMIEQLLHEREARQRFYQETIDLVNLKYHDLKHQIALLRSAEPGMAGERALLEMEETVSLYDSFVHTGSEALDTILSEKSIYCSGKDISLHVIADGKELQFIESSDLCSLFGNILENAIDAVSAEPPENRVITLNVSRKKSYLCIHQENYCAVSPELEDGLPVTTKADRRFHGFGMKSIRYIVEKYGGNLAVSMVNHMFCLDALIPVP